MRKKASEVCVLVLMLFVAACSDEKETEILGPVSGEVTVTGVITFKDDQVPVDGGVTMKLALDDGGTETLLFGSLFTSPPPSDEKFELYGVIVTVNLGDRVIASGQRVEGGILLEGLRVLKQE